MESPDSRAVLAELVDEPPPRLVIAGVGAEEALVAAGEFLVAICLEGLVALVDRAAAVLVTQASLIEPVRRDALREPNGPRPKPIQVHTERSVDQPGPDRLRRPDGAERRP